MGFFVFVGRIEKPPYLLYGGAFSFIREKMEGYNDKKRS